MGGWGFIVGREGGLADVMILGFFGLGLCVVRKEHFRLVFVFCCLRNESLFES